MLQMKNKLQKQSVHSIHLYLLTITCKDKEKTESKTKITITFFPKKASMPLLKRKITYFRTFHHNIFDIHHSSLDPSISGFRDTSGRFFRCLPQTEATAPSQVHAEA